MKNIIILVTLGVLACSCSTKTTYTRPQIDDPIDVAANLGPDYEDDLLKLENELRSAGIPCTHRAISLGASQVVVDRKDFDKSKLFAEQFVIKDKLTVRIYKSSNFMNSPESSLLEVWEKGKKTREEQYKIY